MFFKLLTVAAVAGGAFYFAPQMNEGAQNPCHAIEQATIADPNTQLEDWERGLATLFGGLSNGKFAAQAARENNPDVPPQIQCAAAYWNNYIL